MRTRWASWDPATRRSFLARLDEQQRERLLEILRCGPPWEEIARAEQLPPGGEWLVWAYVAGRGAGKTRAAAEWVHRQALAQPGCRIALVGRTPADVRDVMIEGDSGIVTIASESRPVYQPTRRHLSWPNGSGAWAYSAEVPSQLRGPQHHYSWCFPAGTMIRTPVGQRPVETLRPGDLVVTRAGARRVLRTGSRFAELATVRHGAGRALTGTLDHPVWTEQHGWRDLGKLAAGDRLFTWTDDGSLTLAGTSTATSAAGRSGVTGKYGKTPTGRSRRAATSITATTSPAMTGLRTLNSSRHPVTASTTPPSARSAPAGTAATPSSIPLTVGARCTASPARARSPKPPASGTPATALTAGVSSSPAGRVSAVSGVSISGAAGRVFNLTVEGEHEFFADDVLVHNCDEVSSWTDAWKGDVMDTAWNNLMLGLRSGASPRCVVTTTPKPNALTRVILGRKSTVVTKGTTFDNLANLAPSFREEVLAAYEGTRIGRQELMGELLEDVEGALWTLGLIDEGRVTSVPDMRRVVVGVDPSGGSGPTSDEQGIVVAGLGTDGDLYVLADRSCKLSPQGWASRAVGAFHEFAADVIVAERNFGGEMVQSTIRQVSATVPIKMISASRGKVQRAEPVAAAYEQHRVHHVGPLPKLEDQMTMWTPADGSSPDRMDALVWCITELTDGFGGDAWISWARRKAEQAAEASGTPADSAAPKTAAVPAVAFLAPSGRSVLDLARDEAWKQAAGKPA